MNRRKISLKHVLKIFLAFALTLFAIAADAQESKDSTQIWEVQTLNGNKFYGVITYQDSVKIFLMTKSLGRLRITRADIESIKLSSSKIKDVSDYWQSVSNSGRYFWAPNALGLKKGEGYYQNVLILFNQASIGITDHITLGLGVVPLFLLNASATPVWITPKVSFPVKEDKFHLGGGALIGTVLGGDNIDNNSFGVLYGVGTLGNADANLSIGLGYGFAGGDWADRPTVSFSGMLRLGRRNFIMTENYYLRNSNDNFLLTFLGGRTVWENITLDYGLVVPISGDDFEFGFIALPWLGVTIPFGHN